MIIRVIVLTNFTILPALNGVDGRIERAKMLGNLMTVVSYNGPKLMYKKQKLVVIALAGRNRSVL